MSQSTCKLQLYPLLNEYIARLNLEPGCQDTDSVQTIVILDRSDSMGPQTQRMISKILPLVFSKLSYRDRKVVHMIPFNDTAYFESLEVKNLKTKKLYSENGTFAAPAIKTCLENFEKISKEKPVRLLMISDGEVADEMETLEMAAEFDKYVKNHNYVINAQAVRLFTSDDEPDTTALASLLQVNTIPESKPVDISCSESDETIAQVIADLFIDDDLDYHQVLRTEEKIITDTPWNEGFFDQIVLPAGEISFWLKELPKNLTLGDAQLDYLLMPPMTLESFRELGFLMEPGLVNQLKILKVVGTKEADEKIGKIVKYFKETEEMLKEDDWEKLDENDNVKCDKNDFQTPHEVGNDAKQSIAEILAHIACENVKDLTSAEKAEYLRGSEPLSESIPEDLDNLQSSPPKSTWFGGIQSMFGRIKKSLEDAFDNSNYVPPSPRTQAIWDERNERMNDLWNELW